MRSDYALYVVAVIFFIVTGTAFALALEEFERNLWVVTTAILGLLFIGLGYSQRPRSQAAAIEVPRSVTVTPTVTREETEPLMKAPPSVGELTKVKGIGEKRAEQLKALNINSVQDLAETSAKDLAAKLQISPKITRRWIGNAKNLVEKP